MILTSDQQLDLAAAVAYEHHIMIDGERSGTEFDEAMAHASRP